MSTQHRLVRWCGVGLLPVLFVVFARYGLAAPISDSCRLLGLPFSDAQGYWDGALRLAEGLKLTEFPARRPLYAGYLSTWLEVSNFSLELVLVAQALLIALTISWFCWFVARRHGRFVACVTGFVIAAFFVRFTGKTMTETVGLPLALIAWGWLLKWDDEGRSLDLLTGYLALSIGLLARAGPFFMLGTLLFVPRRGKDRRDQARLIVAMLAAAGSAFLLSRIYQARLGSPNSLPFSNFSFTLYGVARGGKGWLYATKVLPHAYTPQLVYKAAIDSIKHEPQLFVLGAARALWEFFWPSLMSATGFTSRIFPSRLQPIIWVMSQVSFLIGLVPIVRRSARSWESSRNLYFLGLLGLVLSVPFAPPYDADLMRAHTTAIPLVALVTALGAQSLVNRLARRRVAILAGSELSRTIEMARLANVPSRAERRAVEAFPYAVLALIALFLLRPLVRTPAASDTAGDGERQVDGSLGRTPAPSNLCNGAREYALTFQDVVGAVRIGSVDQVERLQRASRLTPALFEPLKSPLTRVGPLDISYAFVRETGNSWAVLFPRSLPQRPANPSEPFSVCAEELDSSASGPDGRLHALLVTKLR